LAPGPAAEDAFVWPPPGEELDEVEIVRLDPVPAPAGGPPGRATDAGGLPPALRDRASEAGDAPRGPSALDPAAGRAQPAAAPANPEKSLEARPAGRTESSPREDLPAPLQTATPPARQWQPPVREPRWRVPWWFVPAVLLGCGIGAVAGWFLRPALEARANTVNVTVETTPPGAEVAIDGTPRGKAPVRLQLPPGNRRLAVTAGGVTRESLLQLTPGTDVVRVFEFGPAPGAAAAVEAQLGSLEVQSRPPGAQVVIAGQSQGVTPVTIAGLPPGMLEVRLVAGDRAVTQQVEVQAGKQAVLVVPMTGGAAEPGWVAVRSPIPLRILEDGRVVGTTDSDRFMLPGGRHNLELVNDQLEVRLSRSVVVQGGRELPLDVVPPQGLVNINARPWAEVFVRGNRLGETPLGNVSLPVGDHEMIFRHPQLGERRQAVTVRASTPTRVSVAFTP
jgi:hypothetical protein